MPANGDSSVTFSERKLGVTRDITATVTFDSGDGSFTPTALPAGWEGRLVAIRTNPDGTTAPTDQYDITLVDADGVDRLQGVGANRATATSEEAPVVYSGTSISPPCVRGETLTLTIANNSVHSAVTVIRLVFAPV